MAIRNTAIMYKDRSYFFTIAYEFSKNYSKWDEQNDLIYLKNIWNDVYYYEREKVYVQYIFKLKSKL